MDTSWLRLHILLHPDHRHHHHHHHHHHQHHHHHHKRTSWLRLHFFLHSDHHHLHHQYPHSQHQHHHQHHPPPPSKHHKKTSWPSLLFPSDAFSFFTVWENMMFDGEGNFKSVRLSLSPPHQVSRKMAGTIGHETKSNRIKPQNI